MAVWGLSGVQFLVSTLLFRLSVTKGLLSFISITVAKHWGWSLRKNIGCLPVDEDVLSPNGPIIFLIGTVIKEPPWLRPKLILLCDVTILENLFNKGDARLLWMGWRAVLSCFCWSPNRASDIDWRPFSSSMFFRCSSSISFVMMESLPGLVR